MKIFWGIVVILIVLLGMFYLYNGLNRPKNNLPENLRAGTANEGLSAVKDEKPQKNIDFGSLTDLENEMAPLKALQETL